MSKKENVENQSKENFIDLKPNQSKLKTKEPLEYIIYFDTGVELDAGKSLMESYRSHPKTKKIKKINR